DTISPRFRPSEQRQRTETSLKVFWQLRESCSLSDQIPAEQELSVVIAQEGRVGATGNRFDLLDATRRRTILAGPQAWRISNSLMNALISSTVTKPHGMLIT
ncbi:hypothetical protein, partial [uncultured Paracoccus sp.]|uniref:hypothetical protein n=1 Tax=uncultured Paracoccus sp. TaxID=189685 RepID=UPI0025D2F44F